MDLFTYLLTSTNGLSADKYLRGNHHHHLTMKSKMADRAELLNR